MLKIFPPGKVCAERAMNHAPEIPRKYEGAAEYYSRYRPAYPSSLPTVLRETFQLDGTGRLLDLGSGPGSVAVPVAHLFDRVVAMDPEPDMLAEGKAIAGRAGVGNIEWVCGSSRDLSPDLGTFRVVTMGESFHWMDRRRTLEALYDLVDLEGGVAILGRGWPLHPSPITAWRAAALEVVRRYFGAISMFWDEEPAPPEELHQAYLVRSSFKDLTRHEESFEVEWTVESLIGNLYSMSFCNRKRLGNLAAPFEQDLRRAILEAEPSGIFRGERHEFFLHMMFKR